MYLYGMNLFLIEFSKFILFKYNIHFVIIILEKFKILSNSHWKTKNLLLQSNFNSVSVGGTNQSLNWYN